MDHETKPAEQAVIGVWTSSFEELTGQAIVTKHVLCVVLQSVCSVRLYKFHPKLSLMSLYSWGRAILLLLKDVMSGSANNFYLVVSRSHLGFLRDIPALLATRYCSARVLHSHGADVIELLEHRWYSAIARWMYSESSLIVPSRHLLGYFDKAKCHVIAINNPVNVDAVIEAASEVGQGNLRMPEAAVLPDKLHVCWNSNVMQSKGFGFAVNSCERLVEAGYHIHFHIFGAPMGDSLRSKQQMSSALNKVMSAPWATYYGQVSRPEMLRAVARADVVVLPTSHPSESQGLAVVEAMALGCQVIASNTEVMRTTTEGYPAVLVAPSDPDALDRALLAAHSKKHKFRASAGVSSHYIREKFSEKNFSRKIINVILTGQNY